MATTIEAGHLYLLSMPVGEGDIIRRAAEIVQKSGSVYAFLTYDNTGWFRKKYGIDEEIKVRGLSRQERSDDGAPRRLTTIVSEIFEKKETKVLLMPATYRMQLNEILYTEVVSPASFAMGNTIQHHFAVPLDQNARDDLFISLLEELGYVSQIHGGAIVIPHNPETFRRGDNRFNLRLGTMAESLT